MLKTVANFDRIGEENAFAVLARAQALAAPGRGILKLAVGQPGLKPTAESARAPRRGRRQGDPRRPPRLYGGERHRAAARGGGGGLAQALQGPCLARRG